MSRAVEFVDRASEGDAVGWRSGFGLVAVASGGRSEGQDRLKAMPGYARFQEKSREIPGSVKPGNLTVTWRDGGKAFEYRKDGKTYRYDIAARKAEEAEGRARPPKPPADGRPRASRRRGPGRGQQFASLASPDGTLKAFYRDRNLWISDPNGLIELAVTTDGSEKDRIKNGKASWVYGEELDQNTAFWWSPDSKKLAYYRFDESKVADYYLQLDQSKVQDKLAVEPYPKAGSNNPIADLFVYDLKSKKTTKVDVRDGKPFDDDVDRPLRLQRRAGRRTASRSCSTGPTAARTSSNSSPPTPRPASAGCVVREEWPTELGREQPRDAVPRGRQAVPLGHHPRTAGRTTTSTTSTASGSPQVTDNEFDAEPDRPGRRGGRRPRLHRPTTATTR